MQARTEDLALLLKLQQADLDALHARKKLEALPQRVKIAQARRKKTQVDEKREQVEKLLAGIEEEIAAIEDEDGRLAERQRVVQSEIDEVRNDYRSVEVRTKELNGIAKRRVALEEQLGDASERLAKVEALRDQVIEAFDTFAREEAEAVASYREEGGALQRDIAVAKAAHARIVADLPDELITLYDKTASRCGGVAVGLLSGTQCSVCRVEVSRDRLIELRKNAPLANCPACQRLLVVEGAQA